MAELIGKTIIHLTTCFIGCIIYHALDIEFNITAQVFELIGYVAH